MAPLTDRTVYSPSPLKEKVRDYLGAIFISNILPLMPALGNRWNIR